MQTIPWSTVLILAAGKAVRIGGIQKQLIRPFGTWSIIGRIDRMVRERGYVPTVVSNDMDRAFRPQHSTYTVDTLLSTKELWGFKTVVLLGDVIYSNDLLDRVFRCQHLCVFGHEFEIFAVTFVPEDWEIVEAALKKASRWPGKLRTFHQALTGVEMGGSAHSNEYWSRVCYVSDYVMDIDREEDLIALREKEHRIE